MFLQNIEDVLLNGHRNTTMDPFRDCLRAVLPVFPHAKVKEHGVVFAFSFGSFMLDEESIASSLKFLVAWHQRLHEVCSRDSDMGGGIDD